MRGVVSARNQAGAKGAPTLRNLLLHVETHGLDRSPTHKGVSVQNTYKTYKQFAKDSAAEVAFAHLSEDAYCQFVSVAGNPEWVDEARKDYRKERNHDNEE